MLMSNIHSTYSFHQEALEGKNILFIIFTIFPSNLVDLLVDNNS